MLFRVGFTLVKLSFSRIALLIEECLLLSEGGRSALGL